MANNTNSNSNSNSNKSAILDALAKAGISLTEARAALRNSGVQGERQRASAAAVAKKTGLPVSMLDGLNLGGLEMVLYAISGGSDAVLGSLTRPDISGETETETESKRASAVRGSSQSWRSLVTNGWKVTISKGGKTYTLPLK